LIGRKRAESGNSDGEIQKIQSREREIFIGDVTRVSYYTKFEQHAGGEREKHITETEMASSLDSLPPTIITILSLRDEEVALLFS